MMETPWSFKGANPITDITKRPTTVGTQFKNDMIELVDTLQKQVKKATLQRCNHSLLWVFVGAY